MPSPGNQGTGAKTAKDHSIAIKEMENMLSDSPSPERASAKIAQMLEVARNEVAVLRLEKGSLKFVYPPELRAAGVIPVSSSAVAARTATTGTSLLSNSFAFTERRTAPALCTIEAWYGADANARPGP